VIGVELAEGPGLAPALAAGSPVTVSRPWGTIADGMTPPFVGKLVVEVAKEAVDDVVGVTETEILDAMKLVMTRAKLYVEGAGAAATAALLAGKTGVRPGAKVVAVLSGGNVDLSRIPRDASP
jgi:threonine dehydratase